MKGCRPLLPEEILAVNQKLTRSRDKILFQVGIATGMRISEVLSLKVNSIFFGPTNSSRVKLERKNSKGKIEGRNICINDNTAQAIKEFIQQESLEDNDYLFGGRKGSKAISRKQAWRILTNAFKVSNVKGSVSCHSMRKTLAHNVFNLSGKNLILTQRALGHKSISSTISYLSADDGELSNIMTSIDMFKSETVE